MVWTSPHIKLGKWHNIAIYVKFSTDPTVGLVEIWEGGKRQRLLGGNRTIYYRTLNPEVNYDGIPNYLVLK